LAENRFRSRTFHTLDEKGRLNLPARFREVLRQSDSDILMVAPWENHLRAFRIAEWEELETKLIANGGEPGIFEIAHYVLGGVVECPVDKQGRIRIPPELREDAQLGKDIALTGMINWFEICDAGIVKAEVTTARANFKGSRPSLAKMGIL
jgi:transcriptional regulator MraZ